MFELSGLKHVQVTLYLQIKILVLKSQLDVNSKNENKENSLIEALRITNPKKRHTTFLFLLKCGIDIHNRDITGRGVYFKRFKLFII